MVTLTEYADFECPYCRKAADVVRRLRARFGERLRHEFRHFPLADIHPHALKASEAALAAGAQGRFEEMHDLLFARQDALETEDLVAYADELELDVRRFKQELADGTYTADVERDARRGDGLRVDSTPTFFVDGVRVEGQWDLEVLTRAISRALETHDAPPGTVAA